jgi:hypothetical protein
MPAKRFHARRQHPQCVKPYRTPHAAYAAWVRHLREAQSADACLVELNKGSLRDIGPGDTHPAQSPRTEN